MLNRMNIFEHFTSLNSAADTASTCAGLFGNPGLCGQRNFYFEKPVMVGPKKYLAAKKARNTSFQGFH